MMKQNRLSELADAVGGQLTGDDVVVTGISIDSRTLVSGDLFIAIKGERFDGHRYLDKAANAGAVAVLVQDDVSCSLPCIKVTDTQKALGTLGRFNRDVFLQPVIAVTGTCGKTSVKEMLAAILSRCGSTMATRANLNNAFGVPLTLLRLNHDDQYAVVELGTSTPGEIDYLAALAKPDVAIITNASENHLKDLVNLEGVIHEKGFILEHIRPGGKAVLNLDDSSFARWKERAKADDRETVSFSLLNTAADCYASDIVSTDKGMQFTLNMKTPSRKKSAGDIHSQPLTIGFWGQHQVLNACCSALAASAVGVRLHDIVAGLEAAIPFQQRGMRYALSPTLLLIDESYNASPMATRAAIDQLADCRGKTVLALGDMLELRDVSEAKHIDIGAYAKEKEITTLVGFGDHARLAVDAFGDSAHHFLNKEALSHWIHSTVAAWQREAADVMVTVLVKGSRGMEMSDVVTSLKNKGDR